MSKEPQLDDRSSQILKRLIDRYIQDGQPVGSRALSKDNGLNLSSASIRNVVSDLEEMGLVESPHTSAGRIPTASGYRVFIDSLITVNPIASSEIKRLRLGLEAASEPSSVLSTASLLLSDVSRMAGLVTLPHQNEHVFRHIDFLPLSDERVLVILVTNEQDVHHRVVQPQQQLKPAELVAAANYLNETYAGQSIEALRSALTDELNKSREHAQYQAAAAVASQAMAADDEDDDFVLAGQTNLMDCSDLGSVSQLRQLFDAFNQKQSIISLLEQSSAEQGLKIVIGQESGQTVFESCSLITSPYIVDGKVTGVVGVIGPTRMHYDQIIPLVNITAKLLGEALNQKK